MTLQLIIAGLVFINLIFVAVLYKKLKAVINFQTTGLEAYSSMIQMLNAIHVRNLGNSLSMLTVVLQYHERREDYVECKNIKKEIDEIKSILKLYGGKGNGN